MKFLVFFSIGFFIFCQSPKKEDSHGELHIELKNLKKKEGFLLVVSQSQAGLFSLNQEPDNFREYYETASEVKPIPLEEPTGKAGNWGGFQFRFSKKDQKNLRYAYYRKIPSFCPQEFELYFFREIKFSLVSEKNQESIQSICPKNLNLQVPESYLKKAIEKKDQAIFLPYELKKESGYYLAITSLKEP